MLNIPNQYDGVSLDYINIGNSATQVFALPSGGFVSISDAAYLTWVASGNRPVPIDSNTSLIEVLTRQAPNVPLWNLYTLPQVQSIQKQAIQADFQATITAPLTFTTAAGVTNTFPADPETISLHVEMITSLGGLVPAGFYLVAVDGVTQVAFTGTDWTNFRTAMGNRGWAAKQHLDVLISQVNSATTIDAVKSVAW